LLDHCDILMRDGRWMLAAGEPGWDGPLAYDMGRAWGGSR
jgi:hypothetical protein